MLTLNYAEGARSAFAPTTRSRGGTSTNPRALRDLLQLVSVGTAFDNQTLSS